MEWSTAFKVLWRAGAAGAKAQSSHFCDARRLACLVALLLGFAGANAAFAGPTIWQDPATGLAMGGYDPIAYFTKRAPRTGSEEIELSWGGAVWRFLNIGNRAAFEKHPQVYTPRFAGYDAYALSNGRTTRGRPSIWVVYKSRIYLFHNAANLRLWQEQRDAVTKRADANWARLSLDLPSSLTE